MIDKFRVSAAMHNKADTQKGPASSKRKARFAQLF
jgi:hypothetical protein